MSDQAMLAALHARLSTLSFTPALGAGGPDIAWKPDAYQPTHGRPYLIPFYRSDGTIPISTNPIQTRANRTYEVQCFVPERHGEVEAYRLADAVSEHFFPATGETNALTAGAIFVEITNKPDIDPLAARPAGFVGVAVLIRCFALI